MQYNKTAMKKIGNIMCDRRFNPGIAATDMLDLTHAEQQVFFETLVPYLALVIRFRNDPRIPRDVVNETLLIVRNDLPELYDKALMQSLLS